MFEIDGHPYFVNFVAIDKLLNLSNKTNPTGGIVTESESVERFDNENKLVSKDVIKKDFYKSKEVDGFRYNAIQNMLEIVMMDDIGFDDEDDKPVNPAKKSQSFKLAFNTLLMYGIIDVYNQKKSDGK
jgi:uncharacterized protein (UPF0335 family)